MFLITTADQRFWKTDKKVLFLGEWCKLYSQKHIWSNLDYEIMPYHWDDRQKLHQDFFYLQSLQEKYLILLSEKLNNIHNVSYSRKYWRIIVAHWLDWFIQVLYDRYLSICNVAKLKKGVETWIALDKTDWTPRTLNQFVDGFVSDEYNHYLYSRLIERLDGISFEIKEVNDKKKNPISSDLTPSKYSLKLGIWKFIDLYSRFIPDYWNRIVFISNSMSWRDLAKLQLSLAQLPYFPQLEDLSCEIPVDNSLRKKLVLDCGTNQFESILDNLIARQIPIAYVEGYTYYVKESLARYPKKPKVILTATAHTGNELFKFWSANKVESGAKLIISQHGGHYGTGLFSNYERREIKIADSYYTWGWQIENEPKTVSLPAEKLIHLQKDDLKPNQDGFILWIGMTIPRYPYSVYAAPIGPQYLNYFDEQLRFLKAVSLNVYNLLLLRLQATRYGWDEASRWKELEPTLKLYQGTKPMFQQLKESRLAISTYNATTFLETLAADFPTIIFWNPTHWELRAAAQPYFDELRRVGILHDTPESAAVKVNEIFEDPSSWWSRPEVQSVKNHFCTRFARTSSSWLKEWRADLLKRANQYT